MRTNLLFVVFACWFGSAGIAQESAGLVPLFDGVSLRGWRGDPAVWRVEDGAIVGSSHGVKLAANTFLIHEGQFGDFELRCRVRLLGANNTGVQYRSRVLDAAKFVVAGYQCDVHSNPPFLAMLYDEGGGGIVAQRGQFVRWRDDGRRVLGRLANADAVDLTEWHELRIVARGDLVWHELDGRVVTAVQDQRHDAMREGVVALQVHQGAVMKAFYRDVQIRVLRDVDQIEVPPAVQALLLREQMRPVLDSAETPQWLWDAEAQAEEEVFFRREFEVTALPTEARLAITCDNHCRVYVNGVRVVTDDSWESPAVVDVAAKLRVGPNVVAVHAWNDGGPAGLALRLAWQQQGESVELLSDADWRCSDDDPDDWNAVDFDATGWPLVRVYAALGGSGAVWSGRHGPGALGSQTDALLPQVAIVEWQVHGSSRLAAQPLRLLDVPRSLGSWVSLACDGKGRLYASAQDGGLFRVTPANGLGDVTTIERVPVELGGAHGLLWWRQGLYAVVNGQQDGLYRLTDSDGDDVLDHVQLLRALTGSGEHGPHSVVVAPDGENLLVLCGNMTKLTELAASRVPRNWAEDRLVPRIEDANGFWGGYSPPGGCLYLVDPEGSRWELLCCGFRNPFDVVVLPTGQVVVYDADMEWDMGLPWYRPTRYLEAQSGVDYGWRKGSAKWPVDYPDAPKALLDIGPGSPTGMVYVPGVGGGIVSLDWTFGTVHLNGKPWLVGAPLPVADAVLAARANGSIYLVTGGRGLPSKLLRLSLPTSDGTVREGALGSDPSGEEARRLQRWRSPVAWPQSETRSALEILAAGAVGADRMRSPLALASSEPDWVAARIALERLPVEQYRDTVLAVEANQPERAFAGLLALARQGQRRDLQPILAALAEFSFADLDHEQRIAWLRVHALALLRQGPPSGAQRQLLAERLLSLLPTGNERQDQDLVELLAYVDAPGLLDRAVPLLVPLRASPPPAWAEVIVRNQTYGGVIEKMMGNMPPMGQLAIANALRTVEHGWTLAQRRTLFTFLGAARKCAGGASYDGYVLKLLDLAWATSSEQHQQQLEFLVGRARAKRSTFRSTRPVGPGRDWQLSDIEALVEGGLDDRSQKSGRNLFHAVGCASCHYFRGEGGFGGPDLTSLKSKFGASDLLEAVIAPSKVISDQYAGKILTKKDGTVLFGVVHRTFVGDAEVYEVVPAMANAQAVHIPVAEVAKIASSPMSPMPAELLNRMSKHEVRDLLAFLLGAGS